MQIIVHLLLSLFAHGGKRGLICVSAIVLTFRSLVVTQLTVNAIYQDERFYTINGWPKTLALAIPGGLFLLGGALLQRPKRSVRCVDLETGKEIIDVRVSPNRPAFIFVAGWGALLLAGAIGFLATYGWRSQVKSAHSRQKIAANAIVSFPVAMNWGNQSVGLTVQFASQYPVDVYLVADRESDSVVNFLGEGQPVVGRAHPDLGAKTGFILTLTMPPDSGINMVIRNQWDKPVNVWWDAYQ